MCNLYECFNHEHISSYTILYKVYNEYLISKKRNAQTIYNVLAWYG